MTDKMNKKGEDVEIFDELNHIQHCLNIANKMTCNKSVVSTYPVKSDVLNEKQITYCMLDGSNGVTQAEIQKPLLDFIKISQNMKSDIEALTEYKDNKTFFKIDDNNELNFNNYDLNAFLLALTPDLKDLRHNICEIAYMYDEEGDCNINMDLTLLLTKCSSNPCIGTLFFEVEKNIFNILHPAYVYDLCKIVSIRNEKIKRNLIKLYLDFLKDYITHIFSNLNTIRHTNKCILCVIFEYFLYKTKCKAEVKEISLFFCSPPTSPCSLLYESDLRYTSDEGRENRQLSDILNNTYLNQVIGEKRDEINYFLMYKSDCGNLHVNL